VGAGVVSLAEQFAVDGAVVLRGIVPGELLERVEAAVEANLAEPSELAMVASGEGDPGRFVEDFCNWERFDEYVALARHVAPMVGEMMGSQSVRLYHDHLLVKEAGTAQRTPWHQDQPYYDVEGRHVVSLWMPLDPVPREATLEFVAGSHLGPWLMPRSFMDDQAKWFPDGALEEVPDVDAARERGDGPMIVGWALEPGDGVLFHALALHSAPGTSRRRRVLSLRFLGDDSRRVERSWRTSPPIPADATFPLLSPRSARQDVHDGVMS
jgi:ectoine hydroxylase-related dioxygenase (phytanoyl-CoA dioxygenase family)